MRTRLNIDRYSVHGEWRRCASLSAPERAAAIEVYSADLLEKRSGHIWTAGAHKVVLTKITGWRTKTFYGETSWSDAARYAGDAATACGRHWWPDL